MTRTFHVLLFATLLAACTGAPNTSDGGDASDPGDATTDARPLSIASGVTTALCQQPIELNSAGMLNGETFTIASSTSDSRTPITAPCNPTVIGQRVFHYRVRGDGVWIRATTNVPGGTSLLDTVLWVLQGSCNETAPVIACNDDDPNTTDALAGRSTLATPVLARGTDLYIVVGGYAGAHRGAQSTGDFTLSVTETASAAAGAVCDSTVPGGCVSGYECASTSPTQGLCVQPDTEHEPNDTPATAEPARSIAPGGAIAIHAAIQPAGDVDCFTLNIPQGTNLYVEANDGGGSCGADLRADLFRPGEMFPFEGDDDSGRASSVACPRISAAENPGAANMAAGTYILCVKVSYPDMTVPTVTLAQYSVQIAYE